MELGLATAVTPHFLGSNGGSNPYFGALARLERKIRLALPPEWCSCAVRTAAGRQ